MPYSPIEQGELLRHRVLRSIGTRHEATSAQIALAWVLRQDNICAIPRATKTAHARENGGALDIRLGAADLAELDRAFPPPTSKQRLAVLGGQRGRSTAIQILRLGFGTPMRPRLHDCT